jgi:hypothetical protein
MKLTFHSSNFLVRDKEDTDEVVYQEEAPSMYIRKATDLERNECDFSDDVSGSGYQPGLASSEAQPSINLV